MTQRVTLRQQENPETVLLTEESLKQLQTLANKLSDIQRVDLVLKISDKKGYSLNIRHKILTVLNLLKLELIEDAEIAFKGLPSHIQPEVINELLATPEA